MKVNKKKTLTSYMIISTSKIILFSTVLTTMSSSNVHAKHKKLSNTNTNEYAEVNHDISKHKFLSSVEYTIGKWNTLLDTQSVSHRQSVNNIKDKYNLGLA